MGELSERLRAAREEKELTLEQVAEETRIPLNYLEALESESFDVFTSDLHARGFLRNYASYLGLDPEGTAALYDQMRGSPHSRRSATTAPKPVTEQGNRSLLGVDTLLALVVIALVAMAALSVYQRQNQPEVTPTAGPPPTPTVTPMPVYEGTAYTMDVYLNYADHKLEVQERIDYTNVTSETLLNLILNVYPNCSKGTFKLGDVKVDMGNGELVQPEVFPLDVPLRVQLPRELLPNKHLALYLEFSLNLPKISPNAEFSKAGLGYSKRSVSLGNWYPVLAPYRESKGWYGEDKGWYQLSCFEIGDPYVTEVADYHVTITATQGVVIAGTGQETHQGNRWEYEAEQARSFAFAASDVYQVASGEVGGIEVHSYYFPTNQDSGEAALQTAVQAMELFTELYGPYRYADYRLAETEFAGGMEFSGVTFLGSAFYDEYDGTARTPLIPLAAHEVSHQWFYGIVGNDQVTEPWLDEAIAEYSAYLYYERYLPNAGNWWWTYAVDQWAPTGKIDSYIFEFRSNRDYVDAVYRRGAQFIRDLRETMGDPAFFAFLKEYQRRYAYSFARSRDFFGLVREFTTADLIPLQEEYFRQRILP
jgi:transcriptional regulator with XRE-family HTH domain